MQKQFELELYLGKLKRMQTEHAIESLTKPSGKTSFDYGKAVGRLQGLLLAEQLLTGVIEEEADDKSK
jgi:hypothetical protein